MKNKEIRLFIDPELFNKLQKESKKNKYAPRTMSSIVKEALDLYFTSVPEIRESIIIEKGLTFSTSSIPVEDLEIQEVSLTSDIKPGDGVVKRLTEAGVKAYDIVRAKRNKRAGREYDKSLEKYFDLL